VDLETDLRVLGREEAVRLGDLQARLAGRSRQAFHGPARYAGPFHHLVQQAPVRLQGTQVRKRSRRRRGQRLVRDDPAARAHEARDPAQGPHRVGLMH
jgi:hypothetical protein